MYGQLWLVLGWYVHLARDEQGILEQVRSMLVPDAGGITAEMHKLNIYSTGGHFKVHTYLSCTHNC